LNLQLILAQSLLFTGRAQVVETNVVEISGTQVDELSEDILSRESGAMKSYEFHWTIADYINAVLQTGCCLLMVDEHGEAAADWEGAPLHGLPEFLLIVARKSDKDGAA